MTDIVAHTNDHAIPAPFSGIVPPGWDGTVSRTAPVRPSKGERFREWLDLFIKTEQVANVLAKTTFVPKAMQNHPAEVAAAMLRGFELDIDPLDALSHMHVIGGRVGYSAEFMRRRIIEAGHEILFPETTDSRAVLKGRRREHVGDESKWQTFIFTEENARKAKIDLGGYPADKLVARASSRMCRRMFPEVLAGAAIAEDLIDAVVIEGGGVAELGDLPDEMRPAITRKAGATVQRKRQPRATATPTATPRPAQQPAPAGAGSELDELLGDEPAEEIPAYTSDRALDTDIHQGIKDGTLVPSYTEPEPAEDQPEPEPPPEPVRPAQLKKLAILFREHGFGDDQRQDRLDYCNAAIGRTVTSSKELTKDEASTVIDSLEN